MSRGFCCIFFVLCSFLILPTGPSSGNPVDFSFGEVVQGPPRFVMSDRLMMSELMEVGGITLELHGVRFFGQYSTWFYEWVNGRELTCFYQPKFIEAGIGICILDEVDVGAWMVRKGYAASLGRYDAEQAWAAARGVGLWKLVGNSSRPVAKPDKN